MIFEKKTILLLGASFTTNNLGVWALASGAIASVLHTFPEAKIYFIDYNFQPMTYTVQHKDTTKSVDLVNIRFSWKFWLPNNIARLLLTVFLAKLIPSRSLRGRLLSRNQYLHLILKADIIGSIAGGDSFSDIYGFGRLLYVALPQILVLQLGKPLVLLPQTYGPFNDKSATIVARYILRRARMIFSRDHEGLETIRELLDGYSSNSNKVGVCYDMGFVMEPHIRRERIPAWLTECCESAPVVGLNVSGLLYIGGYTHDNMFGIKADYQRLIHELIDFFARKHNARIMLVPHVYGSGENSESDVIACRQVYDNSEDGLRTRLHLIEERYDQHELKALIGRCDFFLGSRMHACIAAISQCVPAIGLAYSRKFQGVFESVGLGELVIDIREMDENAAVAAVERSYQRRGDLHAMLEVNMPTVRTSVLNLFSNLSIDTG
jgi:polysaccharide pyruvyl transferase WcaK-like protein